MCPRRKRSATAERASLLPSVIPAKAGIQRPTLCSSSPRRRGSSAHSLLVIPAKAGIQRPLSARHPREGGDPATFLFSLTEQSKGFTRPSGQVRCSCRSCGAELVQRKVTKRKHALGIALFGPLARKVRVSGPVFRRLHFARYASSSASKDRPTPSMASALGDVRCASTHLASPRPCADGGIGAIPRAAPSGIVARCRRNAKGTRGAKIKSKRLACRLV